LDSLQHRGSLDASSIVAKRRLPDWLADNKISILFQMGLRKHPDLAAVPLISDFAKTAEDRQVFEFLFAPQEMGRPFFAPPGVPAERVQALRAAFEQTLKDAQFLAEADRLGLEVQLGGGGAIDRLLERLYATPKTVIKRVKAITEQRRVRMFRGTALCAANPGTRPLLKIPLRAPLGHPVAGASSGRSLAPPRAAAAGSRQAAGAMGLLTTGRDGDPHSAVARDVSLELDRLAAPIEDLAILDPHTVAVGGGALADPGLDEHAPIPVEGARRARERAAATPLLGLGMPDVETIGIR
jgi:hypothetical protein